MIIFIWDLKISALCFSYSLVASLRSLFLNKEQKNNPVLFGGLLSFFLVEKDGGVGIRKLLTSTKLIWKVFKDQESQDLLWNSLFDSWSKYIGPSPLANSTPHFNTSSSSTTLKSLLRNWDLSREDIINFFFVERTVVI